MRVRVTQKLTGDVDGIPLDRFVPGHVYDVGVSVGCYLLALGAVEPVSDDSPALTCPAGEAIVDPGRPKLVELPPNPPAEQKNVVGLPPLAEAADRPRRRRRRRS